MAVKGAVVATRRCALCRERIASAVFQATGKRGEIERAPAGRGTLAIALELFPVDDGAPVSVTPSRLGHYREHVCPKAARAFSAANFPRKRR
jgi:hypothetical protein